MATQEEAKKPETAQNLFKDAIMEDEEMSEDVEINPDSHIAL